VHAGGADLTTIAYNDTDHSRTVTNALGKSAIYRFVKLQNRWKLSRVDGQASTSCPASASALTYDGFGFIASRTDWNGNRTTYVNDNRGLETSRTEAAGTPVTRTIATSWHPTLRLPVRIVEPGKTTDFVYDANGLLLGRTETDTTTSIVPYGTAGRSRTWAYT